jgi:hypothetical protein
MTTASTLDQSSGAATGDTTPKLTWTGEEWSDGRRDFATIGCMSFAIRPFGASDKFVVLSISFDNSDEEFSSSYIDSRDEAKAEAERVVRDFTA